MIRITEMSIFFCLILYIFSGVIGYLMYGENLTDTILLAFLKDMQDDNTNQLMKILLIIINIGFLTCSTTSIPLVYYTLKQTFFSTYKYLTRKKRKEGKNIEMTTVDKKEDENFDDAINDEDDNSEDESNNDTNTNTNNNDPKENQGRQDSISSIDSIIDDKNKKIKVHVDKKEEIIISVILYMTVGIVTILIPKLKSLFNIVGCTAANAIQFIIPSLIIISLDSKAENLVNLLPAKFLLGFGIISLVICFTGEILHLFSSDS